MELLYLTRRAFLICREKMHLSLNVHTSQNITDAPWRLHVSQTEGLQLWEGMTLTTENKIGLTNGQTVTATISDTPNFRRRSTTRNSVLQRNCPGLHAVTGKQAVSGYKLSVSTGSQGLQAVRGYRSLGATGIPPIYNSDKS